MKVLVCGSRTFSDIHAVYSMLRGLGGGNRPIEIISGGASGADGIAIRFAADMGIQIRVFKADWEKHGKAAGPIRNQQMLDEGRPELVVAFVDKPLRSSRGTLDMVTRARKAGIRNYVVECFPDGVHEWS